jgi:lipopolysaccharide transport system ATP-binding protein
VRLAFAVIAHVDADILVVDEALAVGDAYFTQKCLRFINLFKENGGTLLFVSHDTAAMLNLCQKSMLLDRGHLVAVDSSKRVIEIYLTELYGLTQEVNGVNNQSSVIIETTEDDDQDAAIGIDSDVRGEIKISDFNHNASCFGDGGALIKNVKILNKHHKSLQWMGVGDSVVLQVVIKALRDISSPIIGFVFSDRLGQAIFVNNTYPKYLNNPPFIPAGKEFKVEFSFKFPLLPVGDYMISPAVADGDQDNHVQLHWLHDALLIKVLSSSVAMGLIGVPIDEVGLEIEQ